MSGIRTGTAEQKREILSSGWYRPFVTCRTLMSETR